MRHLIILIWCVAACLAQTAGPVEDYQISGVVVDHLTNRPLSHALVQIVRTGKAGGDASVLTDDSGQFAFLHLPKGKYRITAQKRGQMPQPLHPDGPYATAIVVDGKTKTDGIVFDIRTDASISGTVMSDDGEPVRNAQMFLFRDLVNNGEAETTQIKGGGTNSAGHFHFGHLEAGRYYVAVAAIPWIATAGQINVVYPVTFYGDTPDATAARAVVLAEGGSVELPINLRTTPGIHVKVSDGSRGVSLFVAGPGGSRIPVSVSMRGGGLQSYIRGGRTQGLSTNIAGPAVVGAGPAGQVRELINLWAGRYEVLTTGDKGRGGQTFESVELADGSTLDIEHSAGSAVAGQVIFEGARPAGGLNVFLGRGRGGMAAEVGADGTFKFARTTAGSYDIHLNSQGLAIASATAEGGRIVHDKLEVTSGGASVELTIKAVARAGLTTIDGFAMRNGAPVAGAMVLLLPQNLGSVRLIRRDQSDGDGSFTLPDVLPGKYTVVAIDDGRDLEYKNEAVIRGYLPHGAVVTAPGGPNDGLVVQVQARLR